MTTNSDSAMNNDIHANWTVQRLNFLHGCLSNLFLSFEVCFHLLYELFRLTLLRWLLLNLIINSFNAFFIFWFDIIAWYSEGKTEILLCLRLVCNFYHAIIILLLWIILDCILLNQTLFFRFIAWEKFIRIINILDLNFLTGTLALFLWFLTTLIFNWVHFHIILINYFTFNMFHFLFIIIVGFLFYFLSFKMRCFFWLEIVVDRNTKVFVFFFIKVIFRIIFLIILNSLSLTWTDIPPWF